VIGNNLIVNGTIMDSSGAAYRQQRYYTKYEQNIAQTIPTNTWTIVKNFTNVFTSSDSYMTYSPDGFYTNVSGRTIALSISYRLVQTITALKSTNTGSLQVYDKFGSFLKEHARDTRLISNILATSDANTIELQASVDVQPSTSTLAGSTFIQLAPGNKVALYGHATTSCSTDEATICIADLG
jgi:hypothetical protein